MYAESTVVVGVEDDRGVIVPYAMNVAGGPWVIAEDGMPKCRSILPSRGRGACHLFEQRVVVRGQQRRLQRPYGVDKSRRLGRDIRWVEWAGAQRADSRF